MPNKDEILLNAIEHHQKGRLTEAEQLYRQIIGAQPNNAKALHLLGVLGSQIGNIEAAVTLIQRAITLAPNTVEFHSNLGLILSEQGALESAITTLERAIQIDPNFAEAHNNLGNVWLKLGQFETAAACYREAISVCPTFSIAYFNLGNALQSQGSIEAAIAAFQSSLVYNSDFAEAHNNLGIAWMECRRFDSAKEAFQSALQLSPEYAESHKNLGNTWMAVGHYDQAVASYRRAAQLSPEIAEISLAYLQQHICDWNGLESLAQRIIARVDDDRFENSDVPVSPFSFLCLPIPTTAEQQARCARVWAKRKYGALRSISRIASANAASERRSKIRIGYLSADFHAHATAYLAVELFEAHDREHFDVIGYSLGPAEPSPIRERLIAAFDDFHDLKDQPFGAAAAKIASDKIDILVDLKGYTLRARPEILAHRPAPIQVNYLGYPGTMGADFIDYIVVDDFIVPSDQQPFFSECLVHLPGCYQVNSRFQAEPAKTPSRSECGLPETGFIFCSFNNTYKLTPKMFDLWMRLLRAIPGSYLWLLEANPFAAANLYREAESRGVVATRLIFAPKSDLPDHLARHRLADLFLDCFPVNAHTSASDALRMGLPLLTLSGETFVSRVAGSLLRALNLPELISSTFDEYEGIALRFANNPDELRQLRDKLAMNLQSCPLFDGHVFAKKIEKAYCSMWERYQNGLKPRPITIAEQAR